MNKNIPKIISNTYILKYHKLLYPYTAEAIFSGLFRGVQPQIPRGAVGSSSQMVSFAYAKETLVENGFFTNSPLLLSFFGSNLGGLVMTFCLNPFDVVATRLSNQRKFLALFCYVSTSIYF